MSLYLCAGRSGTIRPPSGSPLLSAAMLFLHKYSPLLQLSLAYDNTHTHTYTHMQPPSPLTSKIPPSIETYIVGRRQRVGRQFGGSGGVHQRHWSFLQEISATGLAGSISQWGILLLSVSG